MPLSFFLCFALFVRKPLFSKEDEYVQQEYNFLKKNFLSLAKPVICQWHSSSLLAFFATWKKCAPKIRAKKIRIVWHLSPCEKKDSFRIQNWSLFIFANFKVEKYFFPRRRVYECLLITRGIVIKKSICMIPFHVVQQGYTVRLSTGCIPFQKINLLYSVQQQVSSERVILCCAHSKFYIDAFK